jgi:hypothetical protein
MHRVLPEPLTRPGKLRTLASFTLKLLARTTLAIYFGGFTFYAAVVVPDLHEHLEGMETGEISRRVAIFLYPIGATAFALAWLTFVTDRDQRIHWRGKTRLGLLGINSLILIALILMHRSLGRQIDASGEMNAFRSFHEQYLTVWTGQWLAIMGLMALDAFPMIPEKVE